MAVDDAAVRVDVVIVNWNSGDDLERSLRDIHAQVGVELRILVVDNASDDHSLSRAQQSEVPFELLQTGANLGYAGGNNAGFRHLGLGNDVLVANPDVSFHDPHVVADLRRRLHSDPLLGAVTPVQREQEGTIEHLASRVDLRRALAVHEQVHLPEVPPGTPPLLPVDWVDGAVFLARGEALAAVGGFDERYFLLQEEVDLSIRLRGAGWRLALCSDIEVEHRRGSSWGPSDKGVYYYYRNLYLLCCDHAPKASMWRLHYANRLLRFCFRAGADSRRRAALGCWHGVRRRYGPAAVDLPPTATGAPATIRR